MNSVAIVTGSSRGIGKAIAFALGSEGCQVVINAHESARELEQTLGELRANKIDAIAVRADVSRENEVEILFNEARKAFGKVDVLVNNAGITRDRTFRKLEKKDWDEVLNVNLGGAFLCTKAALSQMIDIGYGRIVNISSVVAQIGAIGQSNYSASKAALLGLTRSLALETARYGITVNAICPGYIETGMVEKIPQDVQKTILERIPARRWGHGDEIGAIVCFLVFKGAYITGAAINANGGLFTG